MLQVVVVAAAAAAAAAATASLQHHFQASPYWVSGCHLGDMYPYGITPAIPQQ